MIELSKTRYGVVKFPPRVADEAIKLVYSALFDSYSSVVPRQLKYESGAKQFFASTIEKVRLKTKSDSRFIRDIELEVKPNDMPENYRKRMQQDYKVKINTQFISPNLVENLFPWSMRDYELNFTKCFDNLMNLSLGVTGQSLAWFSKKDKSINTRAAYMAALITLAIDCARFAWLYGKREDIDKLLSEKVYPKIKIARELDLDSIQHELRHWVQETILPVKQSTIRKDYGDTKKGYYLSPMEFGPSLHSRIKEFIEITINDIENAEKNSAYLDKKKLNALMDLYVRKAEPTWAKKFNLFALNTLYTYSISDTKSPFALYKEEKPTAYKKALKYFDKYARPIVMEAIENRLKELNE